MKQSHNSASSEIISLDADGSPAVQFWACVLETFIGTTAKGNSLNEDDMTKKDHRDVHTRLIPASTPPHLHTTFNCTLSKTIARSTTKAVATINCVSFHRKHRFPSRSLSNTTALKIKHPSHVVPAFPNNNYWPQTSFTIVSNFCLCSPSTARSRRMARQEKSTHRRPARRATARATLAVPTHWYWCQASGPLGAILGANLEEWWAAFAGAAGTLLCSRRHPCAALAAAHKLLWAALVFALLNETAWLVGLRRERRKVEWP